MEVSMLLKKRREKTYYIVVLGYHYKSNKGSRKGACQLQEPAFFSSTFRLNPYLDRINLNLGIATITYSVVGTPTFIVAARFIILV